MARTKTFVTFGQEHVHVLKDTIFDKDCVAVIHHDSLVDGRPLVINCFGVKFCMEYPEGSFDPAILKYFPRGLVNVNDPD